MRLLLISLALTSLDACITFPRAENARMTRKLTEGSALSTMTESAPAIKRRENYSDPYFR